MRPGICKWLSGFVMGLGLLTQSAPLFAGNEDQNAGTNVTGAIFITEELDNAGTQKAATPRELSPAELKAKQEYQARLEEVKKQSLEKQAARRETINDLKQKWNKVENDWNTECTRHDSRLKEIERMPEGPAKASTVEAENSMHRAQSKQIAVERNVVHEGVIKQANADVAGGSKNTSGAARQTAGTKITDPNFRGMNGDFDAGAGYRTTEKAAKILNEIGVKSPTGEPVHVKNGVLETSGKFGMTVNADAGLDKIGSAGHQAQVKMGAQHGETYVSETGQVTQSKPLKDHIATLDHTKKAMHGLNENPEALVGGSPEGQVMAKGTLKAATQADLPPEAVEAIARQHGIKNPENILDRLAEIKAGRSSITSAEEATKLQAASRDILNASETAAKTKAAAEVKQTETKIADLEAKGNMQEAQKLRQEVADYRAKAQATSEAIAHPEKAGTSAGQEPVKTTSPEVSGEPAGRPGSKAGTEPATRPGSKVTSEPEPAGAGGGKVMRGAGLFVGIYGIYEGYQTAVKEMAEKKQGEPKGALEWTKDKTELAGRTLWHGLGFGSMAEIGKKAGEESFEQYKKDLADGKISKDSMSSYGWMKARGVLNGLYGGAKAITYDAAKNAGTGLGETAKEGGGLAKDLYNWGKGVRDEKSTNEDRSKQVYDALIKKGASTVGAQQAADAVKNGDYKEAKRLNKILDAKLAAKNAADEPRTRTYRERKKAAIKKEARKQEADSQKASTDEQLKLREIVIGKLSAKGLPTGAGMVDRLVSILEKDGMPALDAAIAEMTNMQGTFAGSLGGKGTLRLTVQGARVTGTYHNSVTNTIQAGEKSITFTAVASGTLQGDVDLASGSIAMKLKGTSTCNGQSIPFSGSFSGGFTGKGYKGSSSGTAGGEGGSSSWSVSR
ncbi:MAG: hypothetical protein WCH43_03185 [Verrucomicrobiota bacterium]